MSSSSSTASPAKGSGAGPRALKSPGGSTTSPAKKSSKSRVDLGTAGEELLASQAPAVALASSAAFPLLHTPYDAALDAPDAPDEELDEETIRAQMAELLVDEEVETRALTLEIIRQRVLSRDVLESGNQELISKKLFALERIYLDGLSLHSIDDSFDLFASSLTHLYLQRNALTTTQGFSCLKHLRFLVLSHNRIRVVEGLEKLGQLVFLDLGHNLIEMLDTGSEEDDTECQLPEALVSLNFEGNPFTQDEDYVEHIVTVSPYLKTLDGKRITNAMRRDFGLDASDDDEDEEDDAPLAASSALTARVAAAADDEDTAAAATHALRAETDEMRKRSQQRTMLYDTKHGVSQSTTDADRQEALADLQQQEAAAKKAAKK